MKVRDVIVIGAGIAGCGVALALAKRGIPVTILTPPLDQRTYHSSFIKMEHLENRLQDLPDNCNGCSRAMEQLIMMSKGSIQELLSPHYLVDRFGNLDIHRCLQEQLQQIPHVEWLTHYHAFELLTLEGHSAKKADLYRRSTCLGVLAYNDETAQVEQLLAKETILATGGAASLYPYSTHLPSLKGGGFAMAHRAGARLIDMGHLQFHPLAIYAQDKPCIPLPIELLHVGGQLQTVNHVSIEELSLDKSLTERLYEELSRSHADHLWLDLTTLNPVDLKERFAEADSYCLSYGFNFAKDLIPVAPVAQYSCGGILVDKVAQTTLQRLRAVGEVACTGLLVDDGDESLRVLEALTWATTCAEDLAKQIPKFVYYFPEMKEWNKPIQNTSSIIQEDWHLLREIMWSYIGIKRDPERQWRGYHLLERLKISNEFEGEKSFSIERQCLINALQTALLMAEGVLQQYHENSMQETLELSGVP